MLGRIDLAEPCAEYRERARCALTPALKLQHRAMGLGVDSGREAGDDGEAGKRQGLGSLASEQPAGVGWLPRADHRDGAAVRGAQAPGDEQERRAVLDDPQVLRIGGIG